MPKKPIPAPKRRAQVSAAPPLDSKGFSDSALTILAQTMGGGQSIADYLRISLNPIDRFADYEAMNQYPLIARALNVIANEATQPDSEHDNHVAWVVAEESSVQDSLNAVLHQVVKVDHYSWARMRKLAQFGNHFMEPVFGPDGLSAVVDLPVETMRRVERITGGVHGWVQEFHREPRPWTPETYDVLVAEYQQAQRDPSKRAVRAIPFDPFQVVHMRLLGESLGGLYGDSVLEGARWIWRRLLLMDDAAMIFRLHRAPERFAFYLSLGGKSDEEADAMLRKFRDQIRKRKFVDTSGKQRYRYDPVGVDEDFFVGLRNGDESRIETLTSPTWQCLAGETPIPLLDGTTPTIRELAERGGDFTVYSCDATGRIVPGRGHSARVTHEAAPILEVVLDSGEVVRCTGNHPFLTREWQWLLAESLTPNTVLQSLGPVAHRVVEVRHTGLFERVYDLTVDEHHNFAVGQGVIVHNSMDDVEAFRTLLFGGLGVPRAYMGDEAGVVRATLSAQDVNFARGELRLQMAYRMGLMEFTDLHIARCGVEPEEVPYEIYMAPPSAIFELAQMEVRNARAGLAAQVVDFFPKWYILQHIFGLAKDEADALSEGKKSEDMEAMVSMQAVETGGDPEGGLAPLGPVAASQAKLSAAAESRRARLLDAKLDRVLAENKPLREELMRIRPMMKTLANLAKVASQPVRGGPPPRRKSKG